MYTLMVEPMSGYLKKKEHIYAYRRRERASRYVQKLDKIVQESSKKDVEQLMDQINDLWWTMQDKVGFFENFLSQGGEFSQRGELRESVLDKKIRMGESKLADTVAYYICSKCGKLGYLFSPDLDGRKLDLYMLHILWPEKQIEFCHLGKTKSHQILVLTPPTEGILTPYL